MNNPSGITYEDYFPEASLERAFLDTIYIQGKRHFDNLGPIDFEKCQKLIGETKDLYEWVKRKL